MVRTDPPAEIIERLRQWIEFEPSGELGWIADPQEKTAAVSPEARTAFTAASVRWDILADHLPEEHGAAVYRRCLEKARKFALIYAGSEKLPEDAITIEKRHADWAIALIFWLTDQFLLTIRDKISASIREKDMARI